jgi:hypothetical protein
MVLDLEFAKNCMFTDEAGFNLHTQRTYGRPRKGRHASQRHCINGKRYYKYRVIDISLKKPQTASTSNERNANDATATVVN